MTAWAPSTPLNKREWCVWGAVFSAIVGYGFPYVLPRAWLLSNNFYPVYTLVAVQEILMLGVPALLLYLRKPLGWSDLTEQLKPRGSTETGLTMLAAVSFTMLAAVITAVWSGFLSRYGLQPPDDAMPSPVNAFQYAYAFLSTGLIAGICEEMVFRGLLLTRIRRTNDTLAIVVSAAVFALLHRSLHWFPAFMVMGVLLARITIRHRGLFLPFLFHAVYNISVVVLQANAGQYTISTVLMGSLVAVVSAFFLIRPAKEDPHGPAHHRL